MLTCAIRALAGASRLPIGWRRIMADCKQCAAPITAGSRTGFCKPCSQKDPETRARRAEGRRRAFALHPEYRQRQREAIAAHNRSDAMRRRSGELAKSLKLWEHGLPAVTPEVRARQGATMTEQRLAEIPLAYRDDYRILVKKVGAKDARKAILELAAKAISRAHGLASD